MAVEILAEVDLPVLGLLSVLFLDIDAVAIDFVRLVQQVREFRDLLAGDGQVPDASVEVFAAAEIGAGDGSVALAEQFADLERLAVDGEDALVVGAVDLHPLLERVGNAGVEIGAAVVHPDEDVLVLRDQAEGTVGRIDGDDVLVLRRGGRAPHDVDFHRQCELVKVESGGEGVCQIQGFLFVIVLAGPDIETVAIDVIRLF